MNLMATKIRMTTMEPAHPLVVETGYIQSEHFTLQVSKFRFRV